MSDLQAITIFSSLRIFPTRHCLSLSKTMYEGGFSLDFLWPEVRSLRTLITGLAGTATNINEQTTNEQSFRKIQLQQSCSYLLQC